MTSDTNFNKWIGGLSPEITVADAARISLQHRMQAVLDLLPLAAEHSDENLEYVHLLRVWSLRSMAALNIYKKILRKKEQRSLRMKLKKIRDVAGDARDLDVLLSQILAEESRASKTFLARVRRRRAKVQRPLQRCCDSMLKRSRLVKLLIQMLKDISKNGEMTPFFGNWVQDALRSVVDRFHHAFPSDTNDLRAMHQFRSRVKDLRYAVELLAPAFPTELKDSAYPIIEQLQDSLGTINDHAVAISRLRKWKATCPNKVDLRELKKNRAQESEQLNLSLERFRGRWPPDVLSQLLASLLRLTQGTCE